MKKIIVFLMALFAAASVFAEIKVASVNGKCEYENNGVWSPVSVGQSLTKGTKIQTGFKAGMVLDLVSENEKSQITVNQLTRMTIDQLISSETLDKTNISLTTGTLKSDINKTGKAKVNFTIRTPVATASVRGTITEYKTVVGGLSVATLRGNTAVWSNMEDTVAALDDEGEIQLPANFTEVAKNQRTEVKPNQTPKSPREVAEKTVVENSSVKPAAEHEVNMIDQSKPVPAASQPEKGSISVTVDWE